jgi:hypothetical protein
VPVNRVFISHLPRSLRLDPSLAHVRFVVEKVAVGQVLISVIRFYPDSTTLIIIYTLRFLEGQMGEAWGTSKKQFSFGEH